MSDGVTWRQALQLGAVAAGVLALEVDAAADPSLLVTQVPPTEPVPPPVIGPFDPQNSENNGSIGYTVGGIGWHRKEFRSPAGGHVEVRFDGVYQNADFWLNGVHLGSTPTATRRSPTT